MRSQSGFTLVEVLVTGIISTIVGSAILTVLQMSNSQILDGTINLKLIQLQIVASDQIRSEVRKSFGVKSGSPSPDPVGILGAFPVSPDGTGPSAIVKEAILCNPDGTPRLAYRIFPDSLYLYEGTVAAGGVISYSRFQVGGDFVEIDPGSSSFQVEGSHHGLIFDIQFRKSVPGKPTRNFRKILETVRCRNRDID